MANPLKIIPFAFMSFFIASNITFFDLAKEKEILHTVTIKHPGEKEPIITKLVEVKSESGLPIQYYMNVESVICLAEVCKVIPVTLYWNNIGEYQQYELQESATLEKYEADVFETNDYVKLDAILKNNNSPFKDVYVEDIWTGTTTADSDIDAISGETILVLDDKDTVPGAVLTCYTLWHWANGEIVSVIRDKTGQSTSFEQLKLFILNKKEIYFNIALKALQKQKIYSEAFINAVVERSLKDENVLKIAINYLENSTSSLYLSSMYKLYFKGEKKQKLAAIRSLKKYQNIIPVSFLEDFSKSCTKLKNFQEISALLEFFEIKNVNSSTINQNIMPFLDRNFLIGRQAYWFLMRQNLTVDQKNKLQDFQNKYKEKL